jgi:hypothetical protein
MTKTMQGVVHGNTIELTEHLGILDGQKVEVVITLSQPTKPWGDGIRRSAGGWADHPEMDAVMEQIYNERKIERQQQVVE